MKTILTILAVQIIFLQYIDSKSQTDTSNYFSGKVKVTAGKEYDRGGLTEIFLGKRWRSLWTTPFEVNVLNLDKFAGGLTPYKRGGGLQTKSLRFKANDGKIYKFRSINKDLLRILPPDLQKSIFADAFSDTVKGVTLALRTFGGKVWGTHPFYESFFLGGINSLKLVLDMHQHRFCHLHYLYIF